MTFGGIAFNIPPSNYVIDPHDGLAGFGNGTDSCFGAFANVDTRKQSLLYCSAHHSHVEQQTFYLVPPS